MRCDLPWKTGICIREGHNINEVIVVSWSGCADVVQWTPVWFDKKWRTLLSVLLHITQSEWIRDGNFVEAKQLRGKVVFVGFSSA